MKALEEDTTKFPDPKLGKHNGWGAPATSAALQTGLMVGGTGGGKSVSVERDLQQYPQLIEHGGGLNLRAGAMVDDGGYQGSQRHLYDLLPTAGSGPRNFVLPALPKNVRIRNAIAND